MFKASEIRTLEVHPELKWLCDSCCCRVVSTDPKMPNIADVLESVKSTLEVLQTQISAQSEKIDRQNQTILELKEQIDRNSQSVRKQISEGESDGAGEPAKQVNEPEPRITRSKLKNVILPTNKSSIKPKTQIKNVIEDVSNCSQQDKGEKDKAITEEIMNEITSSKHIVQGNKSSMTLNVSDSDVLYPGSSKTRDKSVYRVSGETHANTNKHVNLPGESVDSEGFTLVKKRKHKANILTGRKHDSTLPIQGVDEIFWIYVGHVKGNVSEEVMKEFLNQNWPDIEFSCSKLNSRGNNSSFKVGIQRRLKNEILNDAMWPDGIAIKEYQFFRKSTAARV